MSQTKQTSWRGSWGGLCRAPLLPVAGNGTTKQKLLDKGFLVGRPLVSHNIAGYCSFASSSFIRSSLLRSSLGSPVLFLPLF
jgi:hypothetical protein